MGTSRATRIAELAKLFDQIIARKQVKASEDSEPELDPKEQAQIELFDRVVADLQNPENWTSDETLLVGLRSLFKSILSKKHLLKAEIEEEWIRKNYKRAMNDDGYYAKLISEVAKVCKAPLEERQVLELVLDAKGTPVKQKIEKPSIAPAKDTPNYLQVNQQAFRKALEPLVEDFPVFEDNYLTKDFLSNLYALAGVGDTIKVRELTPIEIAELVRLTEVEFEGQNLFIDKEEEVVEEVEEEEGEEKKEVQEEAEAAQKEELTQAEANCLTAPPKSADRAEDGVVGSLKSRMR